MTVLLLRLEGPLQSWGTQSRFRYRDTDQHPSKSGVIGLLCAALGRGRSEPLEDLRRLRMGVRIDRPGSVLVDYHTALDVAQVTGGTRTQESWRSYVSDSSFLVGMEGEESKLREIDSALAFPRWQLYLGRKSCPPSVPVRLPDDPPGPSIRQETLADALTGYPREKQRRVRPGPLQIVLEASTWGTGGFRNDDPVRLDSDDRLFAGRYVETLWADPPEE